ncbi:hypothetical protein [Desulfobulbus elongatus]|uniref:hypothetical protein n=1 Tax=Desulfobulbus elongatus TaxID=53332 RepID=UPI0004872F91|nr:hypothetical protein [Desulfobulbus elongatus]
MNDLQHLFKLRGVLMRELAEQLGCNMHSVQKTVKGTRENRHIREGIAGYLGLRVDECFGPASRSPLRRLIKQEIVRKRKEYEQALKRKALGEPTLSSGQQTVNV